MARILIIDDSHVMRSLLVEVLTERGHEVDSQPDGQAGIDHALTNQFDLCICDIHMPKKNGIEVYTELSGKRPNIGFIFTDSMPDEETEKALGISERFYLRKPFELEQLVALVDALISSEKTS